MILPWIYLLISRGEFFKHGNLFFGIPSNIMKEDILSIAKLSQISVTLSQYNLTYTGEMHTRFTKGGHNFKLLAYLNCESSTELSFLEKFLQTTSISTILLMKWNDSLPETSIREYFSMYSREEFAEIRISIASHLYVLTNSTLYEIYYINRQIIVQKLENGPRVKSYPSSRKNFQMNTITASHLKDWTGTLTSAETIQRANTSLTYRYLGYMQDFLNFRVKIQSEKDWDEMGFNIRLRNVDLGLSGSVVYSNSITDLKFLMPPTYVDHNYIKILCVRRVTVHYLPGQESSIYLVHITPFQPKIWIAILLVLLLIIVSYTFTSYPWSLFEPVWLILCCCCQQGCLIGRANYVRMMAFTCSLFCVIIYAMYSGSLISAMSTQSNSINSIQQLIYNGYRFGIHISSDTYYSSTAFKARDDKSKTIIENLHSSKELQYPCLRKGIQGVLSEAKYALITEMSVSHIVNEFQLQKEILNHRCWPLIQFPIPSYSVHQTCITRKDSPLAKYFNLARFTMKERGISDAVLKRRSNYIKGQKPNCETLREGERPFTIRDVAVPLFIMGFGLLLSIVTFAAEFIYQRTNRQDIYT